MLVLTAKHCFLCSVRSPSVKTAQKSCLQAWMLACLLACCILCVQACCDMMCLSWHVRLHVHDSSCIQLPASTA